MTTKKRPPVLSSRIALLLGLALLVTLRVLGVTAQEAAPEAAPDTRSEARPERPREVVHIRVDSAIHPVSARFIAESVAEADEIGAGLFVLELDTPGGLIDSTRDIATALLEADVPVVVYVAPRGAQAASAGFFILMAADVAAMAPETNTGASSPVTGKGEDIEGTMKAKVEEDTRAFVRSLAERRGRSVELAESTVTEARSFTATEALEQGLIDLIAPDLPSLLAELDGREVPAKDGAEAPIVLRTAGAPVREIEMDLFQAILAVIANPTIAYLLLSLGGLGLMMEIYNPGSIFPGVVGGICILLAFFGLSVLPVNYVGVALILLALLFFIAEIKVTSYGLLTVGGVICLIFAGLMLIDSPEPALQVSWQAIAGVVTVALVIVAFLIFLVVRTHGRQVTTGTEGLVHEVGEVRSALDPKGKVFVHGELWSAVAETPIAAGEAVEVVGVERMILKVRPVSRGGMGRGSRRGADLTTTG